MPAAGKDTLGKAISVKTGIRLISLRRDLLIPFLEDSSFRSELSKQAKIDLSFLQPRNYPNSRQGLICLGDDLNQALAGSTYAHFADLAYVLYGEALVIPSFRQKTMLGYVQSHTIAYTTVNIHCSKEIRHRRWAWRDGLSEEEMNNQDEIEYSKYIQPLLQEVQFDQAVDNSGALSHLEKVALTICP